jgi:excinuclease ABC subunit C
VSVIDLVEKVRFFPETPGCYLMRNAEGEILYVGKAINLRRRVLQYFQENLRSLKTQHLMRQVVSIDIVLLENESLALIHENSLIKQHRPKYNFRLKDDRHYPYIVIEKEAFPRLLFQRRNIKEGSKVFGPFPVGSNISEVISILTKALGLRDCSLHEFRGRKRPCLLYQMNQCSASCVGLISEQLYRQDLEMGLALFQGKGEALLNYLVQKIEKCIESEEFEKAGMIRDQYQKIMEFHLYQEKNKIDVPQDWQMQSLDVIGFAEDKERLEVGIISLRAGRVVFKDSIGLTREENDDSSLKDYLTQILYAYYERRSFSLPEILCFSRSDLFDLSLLEGVFTKTKMNDGEKEDYREIVKIADHFALEKIRARHGGEWEAMGELQKMLKMEELPRVIECYDIAVLQGKSPTGSQVVFKNGFADKKSYRYYHLEERPEGNNDFAMMEELLKRRLDNGHLPDVIVLDGGKGQLGRILKLLATKKETYSFKLIALAKDKDNKGERVFIPGRSEGILLKEGTPVFRMLTTLRDEAHRFCRKLHHKAEKKRVFS